MTKPRTWPSAVVFDPAEQATPKTFNVRLLDGYCAFAKPVPLWIAEQCRDAANRSFDWGQETPRP